MVATHCLPNGALGVGELSVPNVKKTATISDPGSGNRRGIVVFFHGIGQAVVPVVPQPIPNSGSAGSYGRYGDFEAAVVADGWVFIWPSVQEDFYQGGNNITGVFGDVSNDTGNGSRYLASTLHTWDHIQTDLIVPNYGANRPVIVAGQSFGALKSLQIAANQAGRPVSCNLVGYISHTPSVVMEALDEFNFGTINWSGLDLSATSMNSTTIPGIIGYGINDQLVGWAATTVAAGSNGVNVNTFTGSGVLDVASVANITVGPNVLVTGLNGGTGRAVISFTGTTAGSPNTLTGCKTLSGSGTLATNNPCTQSFADQIITNAQGASQPVTRNATADTHEFTGTPSGAGNDAATYAAWIASTLDPHYPVSF